MHINLQDVFLTIVIGCLCWYVNASLNTVPILNKIVSVVIVVVSVLFLLQYCGFHVMDVSVSR